ncbi:MAG TPA: acetyl-CoA acetyltransferase [Myxococcota bacterium]|nr:acetyl-CoA acetyltransferase [Myxococcota bacterium]
MPIDPRTPVLVGAGVAAQREEDPTRAHEPCALMALALERAGDDAGDRALLREAALVAVPRGFWRYADAGRLVAERLGAAGARTLTAEIGVLQTALFAQAAHAIREGADVVMLTGGEARHRAQRGRAAGMPEGLTEQPAGTAPDRVLRPAAEIVHPVEIARGFVQPVAQYALIENALRRDAKQAIDAHRREVAALQAGFARVAAGNPDAWSGKPLDANAILDPASNPPLAFPYGRLHCSQWTVDQAAGLLFCSVERARRARVPESRWVFPRAVAESNHMRPLVARASLARSTGFAAAWRRALALSGLAPEAIGARELYSCFPSAVRIQLRELGFAAEPTPSWTGGMAFAGGPLNNFVLQAAARMLEVLRGQGGAAVLTAVSGMLTKQGVSLWSHEPGEADFGYADVSNEAERAEAPREVVTDVAGAGEVCGYTVLYEAGAPVRTVALVDRDDGRRSLASSADRGLAQRGTQEELAGMRVGVEADGTLVI